MRITKDYLELHFLVLIWGFTAILGLLITIPTVELVFYRTLLSFLALGVMLYYQGKNFQLPGKYILAIIGTGTLMGMHWILFFGAARVATVSVCLAGMATCTFWTSLLEPLMNKRKIKGFEVILGIIVIIGIYVIYRVEIDHVLGLAMAVLSALLAALFTVINGKFTRRFDPFMITFYEMAGAFLFTTIFFPFYLILPEIQQLDLSPIPMDWLYIGILALICTVFAYSESVRLMRRISAFTVNLVINMEPVYGIILAVIIFGEKEKMAPGFYLGTLIILIAILSYPFLNRYYGRKPFEVDNLR